MSFLIIVVAKLALPFSQPSLPLVKSFEAISSIIVIQNLLFIVLLIACILNKSYTELKTIIW
jgi:hypothetical protein